MNSRKLSRFALFIILIIAVAYTIIRFRLNLTVENIETWVSSFGIWGPVVFMSVYLVSPSLFLPGSILTLAGGALFGPLWGTIYSLLAATAGATVAFYIARYLASDWVSNKVGGKLKKIVQGVNAEGWRFVAFVRLVPLFPFNLLNYALGLTKIRSYHYIVATLICMLPGAFAYTYLGYVSREVVGGGENLITKSLLALSLLAALILLPGIVKRMSITLRMLPDKNRLSEISTKALYSQLTNGTTVHLIDVRDEKEYNGPLGHIAGSHLIPIQQLPERIHELEHYKEKPIAILCNETRCSQEAAVLLQERGFKQVGFVVGGMKKWSQEGLPVEKNSLFS